MLARTDMRRLNFGIPSGSILAFGNILAVMQLRFRQEKATQAAARFLKMRGGRMSYMKLLKLLYLADRKALVEHARPITYDRFVSMPQGPVLSQTYNLMVAEETPSTRSNWRQFISEPANFEVSLLCEPPNSELSPAQEQVIDAVFEQFGRMGRWKLVELKRQLPEWKDPHGSSVPISVHELLRGAGLEEDEIEAVDEALAADDVLAQLAG